LVAFACTTVDACAPTANVSAKAPVNMPIRLIGRAGALRGIRDTDVSFAVGRLDYGDLTPMDCPLFDSFLYWDFVIDRAAVLRRSHVCGRDLGFLQIALKE
jgi:hypothetical protein